MDRVREPIRRAVRVSALLPGLYAWATTVALPVAAPHAPKSARLLAAGALAALLLSPVVALRGPLLEIGFGIYGFVGASLGTWMLLHATGTSLGASAVRSAFGAMAWMLFAFGWGELRARRQIPEKDPHVLPGPVLKPRKVWSLSAELILGLGVLGAGILLALAFRTSRPSHGVLAQSLALLTSLLTVAGATRIALERTPRELPTPAERYNSASSALALTIIVVGLGAMFWMLER
jgi:hypothetical protein